MPVLLGRMTDTLFHTDATLTECHATVCAVGPAGIVLDRTVFYPLGGGQAGDSGVLEVQSGPLAGSSVAITDTRKGKDAEGRATAEICHVPAPDAAGAAGLQVGDTVVARIDGARRHRLMRFHTTTHLLCHLVPAPVNGCSITPDYARLDFNMTEALDKDLLTAGIAQLVAAAHPVVVGAITDAELDANPALVKSLRVQPPRGSGTVCTIRIGVGEAIDFQPCGGTHVANTSEIGVVVVTKIEKKSATTRRVVLGFAA
jgi:misacylated tRNA(Ala) deacylase